MWWEDLKQREGFSLRTCVWLLFCSRLRSGAEVNIKEIMVEITISKLSCSSMISSVERNAIRVLFPMCIEVGPNI